MKQVSQLKLAQLAWARATFGSRWPRAFSGKQGDGTMVAMLNAFTAGWRAAEAQATKIVNTQLRGI